MAILIIEDDARIVEFVRRGLEAEGYLTDVANNGTEGMAIATAPCYELILLDLMLPDISGMEICQQLLAIHPEMHEARHERMSSHCAASADHNLEFVYAMKMCSEGILVRALDEKCVRILGHVRCRR